MSRRVHHGYDFNYPKDQYLDGYLIEKFNALMSNFHKRQAKLHSLATTRVQEKLSNLTRVL